ncbi:hypothetical protein ROZALSC1DRAFT_26274, partial [Rozella allomycis CSF55]
APNKATGSVLEHFDGTNVTNFLEKYEAVAALHYDKEESFVRNFKYFCVPSLREEIAELASGNILNDILLKTPVEKKKSAKPSEVVLCPMTMFLLLRNISASLC